MELWRLKAQAREQLRGNWGRFALYTLIIAGLGLVLNSVSFKNVLDSDHYSGGFHLFTFIWNPALPWTALLYVLGRLVYAILHYGYLDIFIKTRAGVPAGAENIFSKFSSMSGKIIYATLVNLAITLVYSLLSFLLTLALGPVGSILGVALTVIYFILLLRISMVPFILLENPYTTVPDAFIQSFNVLNGYTFRLFVLGLSFIGWLILGALSLGIGYLWLFPYMTMTGVNFYYDVKARQLGAASQS